MVEYKRKKIQLQSGGTRYYYYKIGSDGKKERISKEKYVESAKKKVGGEGNHEYRVWKEQSGIRQIYGNTQKTLKVSGEGKLKYKGLKEEINVNKNRVFVDDKEKSVTLSLNNGKRTVYFRNQSKFNDFKNKYVEKTPEEKQAIKERQNIEDVYSKIKKVLKIPNFKSNMGTYSYLNTYEIDLTTISDDVLNKYFNEHPNDKRFIHAFKLIKELQKLKNEVSEANTIEELKRIAKNITDNGDVYNFLYRESFGLSSSYTLYKINIDQDIFKTYFLIRFFKLGPHKISFNANSQKLIKELSDETNYLANKKFYGIEYAFIIRREYLESVGMDSEYVVQYDNVVYDKEFKQVDPKYSNYSRFNVTGKPKEPKRTNNPDPEE